MMPGTSTSGCFGASPAARADGRMRASRCSSTCAVQPSRRSRSAAGSGTSAMRTIFARSLRYDVRSR